MRTMIFLLLCFTATIFGNENGLRLSSTLELGTTQEVSYLSSFRITGDIPLNQQYSFRIAWAMTGYNEYGGFLGGIEQEDDPEKYDLAEHHIGHQFNIGISTTSHLNQSWKLVTAGTAGINMIFSRGNNEDYPEDNPDAKLWYLNVALTAELHHFFNDYVSLFFAASLQGNYLIKDHEGKEPVRDSLSQFDFGGHLGIGVAITF